MRFRGSYWFRGLQACECMATLQRMDTDTMETGVSGVRLCVDLKRIRGTAAGWVWNLFALSYLDVLRMPYSL